jgi:hypothetical protein
MGFKTTLAIYLAIGIGAYIGAFFVAPSNVRQVLTISGIGALVLLSAYCFVIVLINVFRRLT